jgi:AcrR family transcriptional regulator
MAMPERRRSRREERKEETRAELIAAAARVFAQSGFHGASLEAIAREAGYTTGAIYWYFTGKDDLFLAVFEAYTTTRVHEYATIQRRVDDGELPPRAWADQWMRRLHEEPELLVLILEFTVHAWRNPPLQEAFADRMAAGRLAVARILEDEAARAGFDLPMPAEALGTVVRELGTGLGLAKLIDPDGIPDRLFGDVVELVLRFAVADGRAQPQRRGRTR